MCVWVGQWRRGSLSMCGSRGMGGWVGGYVALWDCWQGWKMAWVCGRVCVLAVVVLWECVRVVVCVP